MKLYLNLLSIFLGIFALTGLAVAEIPTQEVTETETETIEAISEKFTDPTEQSLSEDQILEEAANSNNTDISETEQSAETKSTSESAESIDDTVFVQCPVTELVINSAPNLESSDKKLVTDSDINLEISYEELITDFETIESEIKQDEPPYVATTAEELLTESSSRNETEIPETESEELAIEEDSTAKTNIEKREEFQYSIDCLDPTKYAHYLNLSIADELYKAGDKLAAIGIYREEKEAWDQELNPTEPLPEANYDPEKLSPAGAVYWRIY